MKKHKSQMDIVTAISAIFTVITGPKHNWLEYFQMLSATS